MNEGGHAPGWRVVVATKRWFRVAALIVAALLIAAVAGFCIWTRAARYPAFDEAAALADASRTAEGWYVFEPAGEPEAGLVFYPGGLVDPRAYAPLMRQLADSGVLAVIVPMPLDLAVFGVSRADRVLAAYPDVDRWMLGGHSLGGAMAAEYAKDGVSGIDGLVFLAAYPAESTDLTGIDVASVTIVGTEDGVALDVFEDSLGRLPEGAELVVVEGGNHAQFGNYGPQEGDGTATITREEQQAQTVDAVLALAERLD